jgi:predicted nuclease of predicted toxin-antitoxin system
MIIVDENVEQYWINLLQAHGYSVFSIRQNHPGISDIAIIDIVKEKKGLLLTEDKDFGELVFAYSFREVSIIFLRYDQPQYTTVEKKLLNAIELFHDSDNPVFVTVTKNKTRVRHI